VTLYRRCWATVWLVVGAVPVALGLVEAPAAAVFCLATTTAAAVAATGRDLRAWLTAGLLGGAVTAGLWSTGGAGVGLLALAVVTSPPIVTRVVRSCRQRPRPTGRAHSAAVELPSVLTADLLAGPVHALDDVQLCTAWSRSYLALRGCPTAADQLEVVNLRQAYLDELHSRHESAVHDWLRSGARPASSPRSFLDVSRDGG
jgi:hypothetical protein